MPTILQQVSTPPLQEVCPQTPKTQCGPAACKWLLQNLSRDGCTETSTVKHHQNVADKAGTQNFSHHRGPRLLVRHIPSGLDRQTAQSERHSSANCVGSLPFLAQNLQDDLLIASAIAWELAVQLPCRPNKRTSTKKVTAATISAGIPPIMGKLVQNGIVHLCAQAKSH